MSGPSARLFGLVLASKPLTGHILVKFAATLLFFRLPFALIKRTLLRREPRGRAASREVFHDADETTAE